MKRALSGVVLKSTFSFFRLFTSSSQSKKICIIGSGPAGFYTAQHILKYSNCEVDIYEKLPVPFGLIRYGVAPDHQEIKVTTSAFSNIAQEDRCNFFGNITVGHDVKISELLNAYNAVVLAFGASKDRKLGIPGENSPNVFSARTFVNWYNGHPDHVDLKVDLNTEVAAVIGHGNVALDIARILLKSTDELKNTDISDHALQALQRKRIKKVVLIGRRGPLQISFTIKELREMVKLPTVSTIMSTKDFEGIPELVPKLPRPKKRLIELLCDTAFEQNKKQIENFLEIKFFRSPKSIICNENGKIQKIVLEINSLDDKTSENAKVLNTGEEEEIKCGLIVRSVGYKSFPIDPLIPFDEKTYTIPNEKGKVIGQEGLYCSGWVKTGPTGVILSTMNGSYETGAKIIEDMDKEDCFLKDSIDRNSILNLLRDRGVKFTTFDDWLKINKVEVERGKSLGKPRQKICTIKEMLEIASS